METGFAKEVLVVRFSAALASLVLFSAARSPFAALEADYRDAWCKVQPDFVRVEEPVSGGQVDCLTQRYAIEFGFASKWKEDIAQARWYGMQTGKIPGIVMILKKPSDRKYFRYLEDYLHFHDIYIRVWTIDADYVQPSP